MGKTKQTGAASPIVNMTPQELLRMFVKEVGVLIAANNETLKTILRAEIKASEERTKKELGQKIDKVSQRLDSHEERIERVENHVGLPPSLSIGLCK